MITTVVIWLIVLGWVLNIINYSHLPEYTANDIQIKALLLVGSIIPWLTFVYIIIRKLILEMIHLSNEFNRISNKKEETREEASRKHNR